MLPVFLEHKAVACFLRTCAQGSSVFCNRIRGESSSFLPPLLQSPPSSSPRLSGSPLPPLPRLPSLSPFRPSRSSSFRTLTDFAVSLRPSRGYPSPPPLPPPPPCSFPPPHSRSSPSPGLSDLQPPPGSDLFSAQYRLRPVPLWARASTCLVQCRFRPTCRRRVVGPELWGPRRVVGGGPNSRKSAWARRVGPRRVGGLKIDALFSLSRLPFRRALFALSLGVFSWNFGGV